MRLSGPPAPFPRAGEGVFFGPRGIPPPAACGTERFGPERPETGAQTKRDTRRKKMQDIIRSFSLEGSLIKCVPFGSGHINETWLAVTNRPHLYILQKVNPQIFLDPEGLMNNVVLVIEHLQKKDPDPRHSLRLVKTTDGRDYILQEGKELWRLYEYVTGGVCLDRADTPDVFGKSGKAFGVFQRQMSDFPAQKLIETIPAFHYTPGRYRNLVRAVHEDRVNRAGQVRAEIDFLMAREEGAGKLVSLQEQGELPLRVTHNDTKLNNVMLDENTFEPLCILDLDTVMPGLVASDFGDAIRFGASTADEDETDQSRVGLDLGFYEAYARAFLGACGSILTETEKETLPDGAWMMTLESAVRFMTDYLEGDTYFHVERPGQNLDRARTQMTLVREMERNDNTIRQMIRRICTEG